jgi:hypothetical protein
MNSIELDKVEFRGYHPVTDKPCTCFIDTEGTDITDIYYELDYRLVRYKSTGRELMIPAERIVSVRLKK